MSSNPSNYASSGREELFNSERFSGYNAASVQGPRAPGEGISGIEVTAGATFYYLVCW